MKKLFFVGVVFGAFAIASAMTAYSKTFNEHYKVKADSNLAKAACMTCHVGVKGGKLNTYGLDLQKAMTAKKAKSLTPDILTKVEGLDSDKDGVSNIDEIKKDSNPGVK
jgi:hypothetical protein